MIRSAPSGRGTVHHLELDGELASWSAFRDALEARADVRRALTQTLREAEGDAYYWECCPWAPDADPRFEFMLIPTNAMVKRPTNGAAFAEHFASGVGPTRTFASLGKDAMLVVPAPTGNDAPYGHLASWIRSAPEEQVEAMWIELAFAITEWRLSWGTLWVSTAGGGVPWLHVRLDSRPKYYKHAPYRS